MKTRQQKILITGSNGFIGSHLKQKLICMGYKVIEYPDNKKYDVKITANTNFSKVLKGVTDIIHLAGIAHKKKNFSKDIKAQFLNINYRATINLAKQADKFGINRFIFLSTIKVLGENSSTIPLNEGCIHNPSDYYSESKSYAEKGLKNLYINSSMKIITLRTPLVYGPNVKANFKNLVRIINFINFIPFGLVKNNRRTFTYIHNLSDFIILCLNHNFINNALYHVSDNESISTKELIKIIAQHMKKKIFFLPIPIFVLKLIIRVIGLKELDNKLIKSLEVDNSKAKHDLNWSPRYQLRSSLKSLLSDD